MQTRQTRRGRMIRLAGLLGFLSLFLPALATEARAQQIGPATEYVTWQLRAVPQTVAPGEAFELRFDVAIDAGWKMYALDSPRPSRGVEILFDALPAGVQAAGAVRQSTPAQGYDPNFGIDVRYFEGEAAFTAGFTVAPEAQPGPRTVEGTTVFMICNASLCLPPTRVPFSAQVQVREGATGAADEAAAGSGLQAEAASPRTVPDLTNRAPALEAAPPAAVPEEARRAPEEDAGAAEAGGLWAFLLLAAGAGLAALLTPCVFPMIPLTVSYFTRHADDRRTSLRMALVYGLAIVLTFTALGLLAAALVGAAGAQTIAANPWINLFIGAVFVLFALSLLGLFELRLPNGLLNYFNRQSNERGGYLGVLFMGLTLTLVSFSCTAPFVGGLLAATARSEWAYPILGMLAFSATFSLPFVLFALFPRGLSALPSSGAWMNTVKVVLGFVELAAALKFLSNADLIWGWGVISRPLAVAVTVVIFFLAGMYLIGKLPLKDEPAGQEIGVVRLLFAIAFFGFSLYLLPGLLGAPLNALDAYLPPRQAGDVSLVSGLVQPGTTAEDDFDWHHDIDAAFAEAREVGKPVFIDFTGYTCTNCRQMEANVFPRPAVAARLREDFVLLRLYTDDSEAGPALQRYQLRMTGTVALPTYAVVHPEGEPVIEQTSGLATPQAFAAFLERGLRAFRDQRLALAE